MERLVHFDDTFYSKTGRVDLCKLYDQIHSSGFSGVDGLVSHDLMLQQQCTGQCFRKTYPSPLHKQQLIF